MKPYRRQLLRLLNVLPQGVTIQMQNSNLNWSPYRSKLLRLLHLGLGGLEPQQVGERGVGQAAGNGHLDAAAAPASTGFQSNEN